MIEPKPIEGISPYEYERLLKQYTPFTGRYGRAMEGMIARNKENLDDMMHCADFKSLEEE